MILIGVTKAPRCDITAGPSLSDGSISSVSFFELKLVTGLQIPDLVDLNLAFSDL